MPFFPYLLINISRKIPPLAVDIMYYSINPNAPPSFPKSLGVWSTTLWSISINVMQYSEEFTGSFFEIS